MYVLYVPGPSSRQGGATNGHPPWSCAPFFVYPTRRKKEKKKHLVLSSAILIGSSPLSCLLVDQALDRVSETRNFILMAEAVEEGGESTDRIVYSDDGQGSGLPNIAG
jgi:hypothetical protein